ncbi:MAG TPA: diacylglycerol kinase family lipid kinase [Phycisphaerae bacterium]|nr:diacylglycerol kinase family lipid kinase [Phycisphaerae bacterium]HPS52889.1 diacylglycerol kinase family lipid kinase [Phycisphaerae bacterium]
MDNVKKPVHLIINPISGYSDQKRRLEIFRKTVFEHGIDLVEHTTTGPGNAGEYALRHAGESIAMVAWGGDGTAKEVANALVGSDTPLMVTHGGTENLLAKVLKMPRDPQMLARLLIDPQLIKFDLGICNGSSFHTVLGVGFDAEVVRLVHENRDGHITHLNYAWPLLKTFINYKFPMLKISADGEDVFYGWGIAFVGNTHRYSMNLRICRDAVCDDGLLDLVVFQCNSKHSLLRHAFWTSMRKHIGRRSVIHQRVKNVHIESDQPQLCELDGDIGPKLPLDISLAEQKINMIVPPWKI